MNLLKTQILEMKCGLNLVNFIKVKSNWTLSDLKFFFLLEILLQQKNLNL